MWSIFFPLFSQSYYTTKAAHRIDIQHNGPTTPIDNPKAKEKSFILKWKRKFHSYSTKLSLQNTQNKKIMVMMMINDNNITSSCPENETTNEPTSIKHIISPSTTTSTPMWKLYDNPFYHSHQKQLVHYPSKQLVNHNHRIAAHRKLATSFWDVRFIGPVMDSELDRAKAQLIELKAELEFERKARKKMELVNKKLVREVAEERQGRETLERVCEELGKKVSVSKAEMSKMKREITEERKMLRMAEVFREERVQMKLTEAKFLMEDKILELNRTKQNQNQNQNKNQTENFYIPSIPNRSPLKSEFSSKEEVKHVSEEKLSCDCGKRDGVLVTKSMLVHQRKPSVEPENPHIKRGIRGFVEFPKVVRAMGSKNRHFGTKLECQKAQLNLLLKQKSPMRSSNLVMS